ncbi:MAG: NUDIX domain-containing protein [Nitrospirae bacterium]|nr:NUDIX domain-containing protein [Nitrospirota bacterium]
MGFNYCPACGTPLTQGWRGKDLAVCDVCGYVIHLSPASVVCALLIRKDKVLLEKRRYDPSAGLWCLPGGFVKIGESTEDALKREVKEELGAKVNIGDLLGVYNDIQLKTVVTVYAFPRFKGRVLSREETLEASWFQISKIPWDSLAFPSTHQALRDLAATYFTSQKRWKSNRLGKDLFGKSNNFSRTICIDFDGVIADISGGYYGESVFGKPLKGTKGALKLLHNLGWRIVIYTSRRRINSIRKYMEENDLYFDDINKESHDPDAIFIKPIADIYLDDKGMTFNGDWSSTVHQIKSFLPWYESL